MGAWAFNKQRGILNPGDETSSQMHMHAEEGGIMEGLCNDVIRPPRDFWVSAEGGGGL